MKVQAKFFVPSSTLYAFLYPIFLENKTEFVSLHSSWLWIRSLGPLAWTHRLCLHKVQDQTSLETDTVKFNFKKEDFYLVWFL